MSGINSKYVIVGFIAICLIGGFAIGLMAFGGIGEPDWEDLAEDSIHRKGYSVSRFIKCDGYVLDGKATVSGSFYDNRGGLKSFVATYVNDGGRWVETSSWVY